MWKKLTRLWLASVAAIRRALFRSPPPDITVNLPLAIKGPSAPAFVLIVACLVAANRLATFWEFVLANHRIDRRSATAGSRNIMALVPWAANHVHDLCEKIDDLEALGLGTHLTESAEKWGELLQLRQRWKGDKRLIMLRHKAGAHVDVGLLNKGLQRLARRGDEFVLLTATSRRRIDGHYLGADEALFEGVFGGGSDPGVTVAETLFLAEQLKDDVMVIPVCLEHVLSDISEVESG
ncbi:MAG: hypothetical protein GKS06_02435 [Acidobacteria bacterium]|nr:hypothetical protein [Acidobacteriota bacterium]